MATSPSQPLRQRTARQLPPRPAQPAGASARSRRLRRDYGLELIGRANRWAIAGAVLLTGFLSYIADHSFRGHAVSSAGSPVVGSPATGGSGTGGGESSGAPQAPAQSPTAAPSPAPVTAVSGGS